MDQFGTAELLENYIQKKQFKIISSYSFKSLINAMWICMMCLRRRRKKKEKNGSRGWGGMRCPSYTSRSRICRAATSREWHKGMSRPLRPTGRRCPPAHPPPHAQPTWTCHPHNHRWWHHQSQPISPPMPTRSPPLCFSPPTTTTLHTQTTPKRGKRWSLLGRQKKF